MDHPQGPHQLLVDAEADVRRLLGLEEGQGMGGHAAWTLLPNILVPKTQIPVHVEVTSGVFSWQGVTDTVTADAGQPTAKKAFDFRVPEHGGYTDTSKPTITWPIRFMTSLQDAKGNVQRGDPDVAIQFTYTWVGE